MKEKFDKTMGIPALFYGKEAVVMTKGQERKMEVAEMKTLRLPMGVMGMEEIRHNVVIERL